MKKIVTLVLLALSILLVRQTHAAVHDGNSQSVMLQGFHWESHATYPWWDVIAANASDIADTGFDMVWFPPSSDAGSDEGYLPRKLYIQSGPYGNESQLKNAINQLHNNNVKAIADIVINHRVGTADWGDFTDPAWGSDSVCGDDEWPSASGAPDTGQGYAAARDIDHTKTYIQSSIIDWMNWLKNNIGYDGWRYDYTKGYSGYYNGIYNDATAPYFSVGETWPDIKPNGYNDSGDSIDYHKQILSDWVNATGGKSAVFDFTTKWQLMLAVQNNQYWRLNNNGQPIGFIGWWPAKAVTFLDNHDTGSSPGGGQNHWPFPGTHVMQGYAYILTHPGIPSVYWPHIYDWGLKAEIKKLIEIRTTQGLTSSSTVDIKIADGSVYAAIIDGKVAMKIGAGSWNPGADWSLEASGNNYAVWVSGSSPATNTNIIVSNSIRTVVFLNKETSSGQDLFIKGGHDAALVPSVYPAMEEAITYLNTKNTTTASIKAGDSTLDWGSESALDWTTDTWPADWGTKKTYANDGYGEDPENTWGSHWWKFDVAMTGVSGEWFEFKAFMREGSTESWETDINQAGTPQTSRNHWGKKGFITRVIFGDSWVEFIPLNDDPNLAPTASIGAIPVDIEEGESVSFDATASSDPEDGYNIEVRWDYDGDGSYDTSWATAKTSTHVYNTAGTYQATLQVRDSGGLTDSKSLTVTVAVAPNTDPIASFIVSPAPVHTGQTVTFDASASTDNEDGANIQVRFDFDGNGSWDTSYSYSKSVTHTYSTVGTKTVTLEVKDSEGATDTATVSVTVSEYIEDNLDIYYKKPADWGSAYIHYWNTLPGNLSTAWPGTEMTDIGGGWYHISITNQTYAKIVFNANSSPQSADLERSGDGWYDGTWHDSNPDDSEAPIISLTTPSAGSIISGIVTLNATASDNIAVTKVEFFYGSTKIGEDTTAPYSVSWDTTSVSGQSYNLTSRAFDAAGNSADSSPVNVTVSNTIVKTLDIYYKNINGWGTVSTHYWLTQPDSLTTTWPGIEMESIGNDWYHIAIPNQTSCNIIFHNNAGAQTGDLTRTGNGWYDGKWHDENPDAPSAPQITVSVSSERPYTGDTTVTILVTANNAPVDSVSANFNGSPLTFSGNSAQFTLSSYLADLATGTLSVSATNSLGAANMSVQISRDDSYQVPVGEFTWDNALVYFVIQDRFYNGNTANDEPYGRKKDYGSARLNTGTYHGGDLAGLTQKLEEGFFSDLGINAIWLTAVYEQSHGWCGGGDGDFPHYPYHGYYALDYTAMDKNMGTIEEMRAFVDAAHKRGIRVIMDIVLNHVGYNTILDMNTYGFGDYDKSVLVNTWEPSDNNWSGYHDYIKYQDGADAGLWQKWYGSGWVRGGLAGYTSGDGSEMQENASGLADIRTELTSSQGLPPVLQTKWSMESTGYEAWINPSAAGLRQDLNISPADYVIKWLAAWVEEFGIDGFRCDTAKHVELYRWAQLKNESDIALKKWRINNPDKAGADWDEDFWMTGEHWNHGLEKDGYFSNGFDSIINFTFPNKDGNTSSVGDTWQGYADTLNSDPDFNVLTYISSHDSSLEAKGNKINAGTCLLLTPGGVQVFYGDENDRPLGPSVSDADQSTRSDYVWGANPDILAHWQKLGKFRNMNPAVGAGSQTTIVENTYGRIWNDNRVVIRINASGSTTVNVGTIFSDGTSVRNAYNGETGIISGGSVTFTAENGVILIEENK